MSTGKKVRNVFTSAMAWISLCSSALAAGNINVIANGNNISVDIKIEQKKSNQHSHDQPFSVTVANECPAVSSIEVYYSYMDKNTGQFSDVKSVRVKYGYEVDLPGASSRAMIAMGSHYYLFARGIRTASKESDRYIYWHGEGQGPGRKGYRIEIQKNWIPPFMMEPRSKTLNVLKCSKFVRSF